MPTAYIAFQVTTCLTGLQQHYLALLDLEADIKVTLSNIINVKPLPSKNIQTQVTIQQGLLRPPHLNLVLLV